MKKMKLESLELRNFKGTQYRKIEFGDITDISAGNRKGKTTVFDALLWLLADIDSNMNSGIGEVKMYNENNEIIHNIENSVVGIFTINNQKIELSKTVKEVWSNETTFKNTVVYEIDKVAISKKDYQSRLENICNSEIMQLLIFPLSFFGKKYDTVKRREFISGLAEITEVEKSEWLTSQLKNTDIVNLKKSLNKSIKESQKLIENNQARIDELTGQIKPVDVSGAEKKIKLIENEVIGLQNQLSSIAKIEEKENSHYDNAVKQVAELQQKKSMLQSDYNRQLSIFEQKKQLQTSKIQLQINTFNSEIESKKQKITQLEKNIELSKNRRLQIKNEVAIINVLSFDENATICPTCNRIFEASQIEEIKEKFNTNKVTDFNKLLTETQKLKVSISENENQTGDLINEMSDISDSIEKAIAKKDKIEAIIFSKMNEKHISFLYSENEGTQIATFLKEYNISETGIDCNSIDIAIEKLKEVKPYTSESNDKKREEISNKIAEKNKEVEPIRDILQQNKTNTATESRIKELREAIKNIMSNIQEATDRINDIDNYTKAQMSLTEEHVNNLFSFIKVSMFETLQNGNINDVCEITANGVPFSVLNTESKCNALIDIQNAISKRYGVQLPAFIDNRESTHKIIDTELQVVNLYHAPDSEFEVKCN